MQISRCRFWWCAGCHAVFEKEDLESKIDLLAGPGVVTITGTRECGNCRAIYQLKDIYAGVHDVPRQYWSRLRQPVEICDKQMTSGSVEHSGDSHARKPASSKTATLHITCPKCGRSLRLPTGHAGTKGKCPGCGTVFVLPEIHTISVTDNASRPVARTSPDSALSHCRYFVCKCGAVFEKVRLDERLRKPADRALADLVETIECAKCHAVLNGSRIYLGQYDLPEEHWTKVERQNGKSARVQPEARHEQSIPRSAREYYMPAPVDDDGDEYRLADEPDKPPVLKPLVPKVVEFQMLLLDQDCVAQIVAKVQEQVRKGIRQYRASGRATVSITRPRSDTTRSDAWGGRDYLMPESEQARRALEEGFGDIFDAVAKDIAASAPRMGVSNKKNAEDVVSLGVESVKDEIRSFVACIRHRDKEQISAVLGLRTAHDDDDVAAGLAAGIVWGGRAWKEWRDKIRRGPELSAVDLSKCQLSGAFLNDANLTAADLSRSLGFRIHLQNADLRGGNLQNCWWYEPHLQRALLQDADVRRAALGGLRLTGDWTGARFNDAYLHIVEIQQPLNLAGADLSGCEISAERTICQQLIQHLSTVQRRQLKFCR